MKRIAVDFRALLSIFALTLTTVQANGQAVLEVKEKSAAEKPAAPTDPAVIAKLIQQLGSADFEAREKASLQLAKLDEVPELLREAAKSTDLEVGRRAQAAIAAISAQVEQKKFQALVRELNKIELDRVVRRMVTDERFADDKQWALIQAVAQAVTNEANKLGERKFDVPDFEVSTMRHLLYKGKPQILGVAFKAVVLSAGPTPHITVVRNSILIVDGDFEGATGIDSSLLIVRGNVGRITSVRNSIILATGNFEGATSCDRSFLQVNNPRIRFTDVSDSVLIKTVVRATTSKANLVLDAEKGPLQLLKFSPRKADDELVWGKEVNNLTVAIAPADQKDQFLIRWKNVGKDAWELPVQRLESRNSEDDLLNHVFLKGPDGKLVPARNYPGQGGGPPSRRRGVVLEPGQTHEETIDLWTYVDRPEAGGRYQLSIELELPNGRRGEKSWSGKIQSNVLEVMFGK